MGLPGFEPGSQGPEPWSIAKLAHNPLFCDVPKEIKVGF